MSQFLAIVAYRSLVAGTPNNSLDIQVRWFLANDAEEVRRKITADPLHSYENTDGDTVTWELAEIFQIEPFAPQQSGDEVVGFIAKMSELIELA